MFRVYSRLKPDYAGILFQKGLKNTTFAGQGGRPKPEPNTYVPREFKAMIPLTLNREELFGAVLHIGFRV